MLLRIISGLSRPTEGHVSISGAMVDGPAEGVAMVFQSFALFPWLSVLDNVEIGPRAQGVPNEETRKRALQAIDVIGLDGFESAYPKELSGGMRQRVGFARALVVQPKILLMDVKRSPTTELGITPTENDLTRQVLLKQGVTNSDCITVGHGVASTYDESRAVRAWVEDVRRLGVQ